MEDFDAIIKKVYGAPVKTYDWIEGDIVCSYCGMMASNYDGHNHCDVCGGKLVLQTPEVKDVDELHWAVDESGFRHPFVEDKPESDAKFIRYEDEEL